MDMNKKILIADASSFDRSVMLNALKNTYPVLESNNGLKALELFTEEAEHIKLAVIDITLPYLDGFQLLKQIKRMENTETIPIILTSAEAVKQDILDAFRYGAADFVVKPFEADFFRQRVLSLLSTSSSLPGQALSRLVSDNAVSLDDIIEYDKSLNRTFRNLFSYRRIETPYHIKRVSLFTGVLLRALSEHTSSGIHLNEPQIQLIIRAAAYHDIGKIAIPDLILKNRDRLTEEQRLIYHAHTTKGAELLQINNNPALHSFVQLAVNIAQNHHEKWDGSGYPGGLRGNRIPLSAQVVGFAADFDKYSRKLYGFTDSPFEESIKKMLQFQHTYNPMLIRALAYSEWSINEIIDKYPEKKSKK